jgi:Asp/Glu/hydantoin racemase
MKTVTSRPRVALIHALAQSQPPVLAAFAALWPEAETFNLLEDSLAPDLAAAGGLNQAMLDRFVTLGRYAAQCGVGGRSTDGILFTCSAFGPAIEQVKGILSIPVLKPNEAAFEQALELGEHIGLVVTFASALSPMLAEFQAMTQSRRLRVKIEARLADGALEALRQGSFEKHDELIAEAAHSLGNVDALILGQFSMARAAPITVARTGRKVLTTPDTAVKKLRDLISSRG